MTEAGYRNDLIDAILKIQTKNQFTLEQLKKKATRTLERIYENID